MTVPTAVSEISAREIDGTAAGLVGGTASSQFTGFHKIELDLWTDGNLTAAAADAATLQQLVKALVATPIGTELPVTQAGIANWVLRPHEILEDAVRDTLTGNDDYGSGTALASVGADISAVRELLGLLAPVLDPLAPDLVSRVNGQLNAVLAAVDQAETSGASVSVANLPSLARERVDAAVDAAVETLAPIPDLITSTGNVAPLTCAPLQERRSNPSRRAKASGNPEHRQEHLESFGGVEPGPP